MAKKVSEILLGVLFWWKASEEIRKDVLEICKNLRFETQSERDGPKQSNCCKCDAKTTLPQANDKIACGRFKLTTVDLDRDCGVEKE